MKNQRVIQANYSFYFSYIRNTQTGQHLGDIHAKTPNNNQAKYLANKTYKPENQQQNQQQLNNKLTTIYFSKHI